MQLHNHEMRRIRLRLTFTGRDPAYSVLAKHASQDQQRTVALSLINIGHLLKQANHPTLAHEAVPLSAFDASNGGKRISIRLSVGFNEVSFGALSQLKGDATVRDQAMYLANIGSITLNPRRTEIFPAVQNSKGEAPSHQTANDRNGSASVSEPATRRSKMSGSISAFLSSAPVEVQ